MDLHLNGSSLAVAELEKGPVIAALYPVVFFLGQAGLAFWLGTVVYLLLIWVMQAGVELSILANINDGRCCRFMVRAALVQNQRQ